MKWNISKRVLMLVLFAVISLQLTTCLTRHRARYPLFPKRSSCIYLYNFVGQIIQNIKTIPESPNQESLSNKIALLYQLNLKLLLKRWPLKKWFLPRLAFQNQIRNFVIITLIYRLRIKAFNIEGDMKVTTLEEIFSESIDGIKEQIKYLEADKDIQNYQFPNIEINTMQYSGCKFIIARSFGYDLSKDVEHIAWMRRTSRPSENLNAQLLFVGS